jgi:exosortase A
MRLAELPKDPREDTEGDDDFDEPSGLFGAWHALRGTGISLILGILLLGVLFRAEVVTAIQTWNDSTAYNHCFMVIPIAAYLIWDRRSALVGLAARPAPWVALAGLPLAVAWLVTERLGIMEGRQLIALTFLEVLFLGVLGWKLWRAISGPLLYLYFLVPFGEFLTPKLQDITTVFVRHGLDILNIPAYIDGYVIEIAEGTFFIAQACAGLRFLIAAIAFGALYALLMYRSPVRRAVFILISIVIPVIANGFRALGIVSLGHVLGSAEAAATDHVLYGWIFFSLVILLLLACGLPFREDSQPDPAPPVAMTDGPHLLAGALASALLVIVAGISPVSAMLLDRSAVIVSGVLTPLDPGAVCTTAPGVPPQRARPASGGIALDQRITCGDSQYDIHIAAFSPRSTAGPVMTERRRLGRPPDVEETREEWLEPQPHVWRIIDGTEQPFTMAIGVWIDGAPTMAGLPIRARMGWNSVTGGRHAPIVVSVTQVADWSHVTPARRQALAAGLKAFLRDHADWDSQIRAMSARP